MISVFLPFSVFHFLRSMYLTDVSETRLFHLSIKKEHINLKAIYNINTLRDALNIQEREVISLVGAGGKSTLMYAIAKELSGPKDFVITTTSTKIFPPTSTDCPNLFISENEQEIVTYITNNIGLLSHVTLASKMENRSGKLIGLDPEIINRLTHRKYIDYTIIEADGAAMRPLKAPDIEFEPNIPISTTLVIPVVGIDALGCMLEEKNVFRAEIASNLSGTPLGRPVTEETIVRLVVHNLGLTYGSPVSSRIIPFINKVDLDRGLIKATKLASKLLSVHHPQINRVVLGQARMPAPVIAIINR